MLRHVNEKHVDNYEYWNCPEFDCNVKFIRRDYIFRHLTAVHQIDEATARVKAINANRGDHQVPSYYSDISDDDTILDLINDEFDVADVITDSAAYTAVDEFEMNVDSNGAADLSSVSSDSFVDSSSDAAGGPSCDSSSDAAGEPSCDSSGGSSDSGDQSDDSMDLRDYSSDDSSDDSDDDKQICVNNGTVVKQTVILTLQRTVRKSNGQQQILERNCSYDFFENFI